MPLGKDPNCPIALSLEVVGEKWSLLIIREASTGATRFSEFQAALGIAKNVLAERLSTLVEYGVLDRQPYRDSGEREREEYVLTPAGRELRLVLGALSQWGSRNRPTESRLRHNFVDTRSGDILALRYVSESGRVVKTDAVDVKLVLLGAG